MSTNIFIVSRALCHELVGDWLQQLRLVFLGADEVTSAGRSRLWGQNNNEYATLYTYGTLTIKSKWM